MNRCDETDLLVDECADCRIGKHGGTYIGRLRMAPVVVKAAREPKLTPASTAPSVTAEANYLIKAIDRLAEADWVDEAMAEIRTVWSALTRAHGYIAGTSVGPCLTAACDGKVFRDRFTGFPECNVCHRIYQGIETLKVQLTEEASA